MEKVTSSSTKGHRERVRKQLLAGSELSDKFLMELILMYGIPQKDVKHLANALISEYGSLDAVLKADETILAKKPMIKDNATALFKLIRVLIDRYGAKGKQKTKLKTEQTSLFEKDQNNESVIKSKLPKEIPLKIFTSSIIIDIITCLPSLPEKQDYETLTTFVREKLHYNSHETRRRYASYVMKRLFPSGKVDSAIISFAKAFINKQDMNDVCFYRYLKAEPLVCKIVNDLLLNTISKGFIDREDMWRYLNDLFPGMKSIRKCVSAITEVLSTTRICNAKKGGLTLRYRKPELSSFAFIIHSEFNEPGIYDTRLIEKNKFFKAMFWDLEKSREYIYELRNNGILSKVSDIDGMRQFTTKYGFDEAVKKIIRIGVTT